MEALSWDNPFGCVEFDYEVDPSTPGAPLSPAFSGSHEETLSRAERAPFPAPQSVAPWPAGLTFDLALGVDATQTVLERYEITAADYERLMEIPTFRRELAAEMKRNQDEGISFTRKAAAMAEECLPDMYAIVKNPLIPASTRADVWKAAAKLGNLEPKDKGAALTNVPQIAIQINL